MGLNQNSTPWTEERKTAVVRMLDLGYSYSMIAAEIGTTRNSVGGYVQRQGLCKNPTGARVNPTAEELFARRERQRASQNESKRRRREANAGARLTPQTFKRRYTDVVPQNIPFDEMHFGRMCAYPIHEAGSSPSYCGHGVGLKKNGKPSAYCQGHHSVVHA